MHIEMLPNDAADNYGPCAGCGAASTCRVRFTKYPVTTGVMNTYADAILLMCDTCCNFLAKSLRQRIAIKAPFPFIFPMKPLVNGEAPELDHARRYILKHSDLKLSIEQWDKVYKLMADYRAADDDDIWFGSNEPFQTK